MNFELEAEFDKFRQIAARMQMNTSEHEAQMIAYRLDELRKRFETYDKQGLSLANVRLHEEDRNKRIVAMNKEIR